MSDKKFNSAVQTPTQPTNTKQLIVEDISMRKVHKRRRIVKLPNLTPEIELPKAHADVLQALIVAGNKGVSTAEFGRLEIYNVSQKIGELKKRGVIISTTQGTEYDSRGDCHYNIGRYFYNGCVNV